MGASRRGGPPEQIEESKVILAEGADACWFLIWAYQAYHVTGIRVFDFGGIKEFSAFISAFVKTPGFDQVDSLVVARDAENDAEGAMASIANALAHAGLPKPTEPFTFASGAEEQPRTAIMIFPGFASPGSDRRDLTNGTLEDLCLRTLPDSDSVLSCVDEYLKCVRKILGETPDATKSRLHAYLSGKARLAGLKLGEATNRGKVWDLQHEALSPFKTVIEQM